MEQTRRNDGADHGPGVYGVAGPSSPGTVYRTLLLRVGPDTPPRVPAEFEADLLWMPRHVSPSAPGS